MSVHSYNQDSTVEPALKTQIPPENHHKLDYREEQRLSDQLYSALHCHRSDSGLFDHQQTVRGWTGLQKPTKVRHSVKYFAKDIAERMVRDETIELAIREFCCKTSLGFGPPITEKKVSVLLQKYLIQLYVEACEVVIVSGRKKKRSRHSPTAIKAGWRRLKPVYPSVFVQNLTLAEHFARDGGWWFEEQENKAWAAKGFIRCSKAYKNLEVGLRNLRRLDRTIVEVEAI